ncbi:MAG: hypothetical protein ABII81_02380 [Pseudomonadota bacterium]
MANQPNANGSLSGTRINFFGPAMNVNNADATLSGLQNRSAMPAAQQSNATLHYMSHVADPIGGIIGWNDPTGGTIPMGSSPVWERLRAATGQENTSHNLYFVDYGNFQPTVKPELRLERINKFWGNGNPTLQPAKK